MAGTAADLVALRGMPFRPRDRSFGTGFLWAVVSVLTALWIGGIGDDRIRAIAGFAGAAALVLPLLYLFGSILRQVRLERGARTWDLMRDGNPYPSGLEPFDAHHSAVLFGREEESQRVLARLRSDGSSTRRFVPLEGPSGCGKSSILKAAILPELRKTSQRRSLPMRRQFDVIGPFSPGLEPFEALAAALQPDSRESWTEVGRTLEREGLALADSIERGHRAAEPVEFLGLLRQRRTRDNRFVLAIDQLEELVVTNTDQRRHAVMALILAAIENERRLSVVCTIRSDFSGDFLEGPGKELFRAPEKIEVMGPQQRRQVIRGPALASGVAIETDVVDTMVDDFHGGDSLPLLCFVLHTLYESAVRGRVITMSEYGRVMGPQNAIAKHADEIVALIKEANKVSDVAVTAVLLEAVNVAGGGVARRRFLPDEMGTDELGVAIALADARLLAREGDGTYQLTHEVLLREWPRLREAVDDNREFLRARTALDLRARDWVDEGRPAAGLLTSVELNRLRSFLGGFRGVVGDFVDASVRHDLGEMTRRADLVARQAVDALDPPRPVCDAQLALRLAIAANIEIVQTLSTAYALYRCWWYGIRGVLRGHAASVAAVAWSSDGERLATASHDRTGRIWSAEGELVCVLSGHSDRVDALAWSPDGARIATVSSDTTMRIWSSEGEPLHELSGHTDRIYALAWSPDGAQIATAGGDTTLRIWPDPLPVSALLPLAMGLRGVRELTREERQRSVLPVDPESR